MVAKKIVKNILWKFDSELDIAYFCPGCKKFLCDNEKKCECGQEINWDSSYEYKDKVRWS